MFGKQRAVREREGGEEREEDGKQERRGEGEGQRAAAVSLPRDGVCSDIYKRVSTVLMENGFSTRVTSCRIIPVLDCELLLPPCRRSSPLNQDQLTSSFLSSQQKSSG
ncbi:Hypothetical predicted protein [Scomber scombrus]|uniref:Uncharacterized protein n=1 Tax=Scomber scombrus TaxID=13677 RepID=A0AAV1Q0L3_SCOSC